jgi:hypothetical protein
MMTAIPKYKEPRRTVTLNIHVHRALRLAAAEADALIGDLADELIKRGLYDTGLLSAELRRELFRIKRKGENDGRETDQKARG